MINNIFTKLRRRTSGKFIAEIDGLRFLAITPVLFFHLAERVMRLMKENNFDDLNTYASYKSLLSGRLGVEIFFVISGFVISIPILKKWIEKDSVKFDFLKYLKKRLTRLEPPYIAILLFSLVALTFLRSSSLSEGTDTLANSEITLVESFWASIFYLHGLIYQSFPRLNPPSWSLEIEFQFYLLAPLLLIFSIYLSRKLNLKITIVLIVLTIVLHFLFQTFFPAEIYKYIVFNYLEFFIIGFIFAILYLKKELENELLKKYASLILILGILITYVSDYNRGKDEGFQDIYDFSIILGIFLIFLGSLSGGIGKKFVSLNWVSTIGGMCYSIYLIHLFVFQIGARVLGNIILFENFWLNMITYSIIIMPVTIFLAGVFFIIIEKPCMNPEWPKILRNKVYRFLRIE